MDEYKLEADVTHPVEIPVQLNATFIRPPGIPMRVRKEKDLPISNSRVFQPGAVAVYEINSLDFMDPYSLFFAFTVQNLSNSFIQLDNSAHSIIQKIIVKYKKTGEVLEQIEDYDMLMAITHDLQLTRKDREIRKEFEGFGDNEYGSNETVLFPQTFTHTSVSEKIELNPEIPIQSNLIPPGNQEIFNEPLYEPYDIEIDNMENWKHVYNGKVQPCSYETDKYESMKSKHYFRIPLMLKTIGNGIQRDNFKLIPMEIIGPIVIEITFNPHAFFVPVPVTKYAYYAGTRGDLEQYYKREAQIKFEITDPRLEYEMYELDQPQRQMILDQVREGKFILDYKGINYVNQFYILPYPTVDASSLFREKTEIRGMYFGFYTNLYQKTPLSRKQARHNKGIKKIEFKYKNGSIPKVVQEHNSLCTFGEHNSFYFYNQLAICMCNPESVITPKTFSLNISMNEIFALNHYAQSTNAVFDFENKIFFTTPDWSKLYNRKSVAKLLLKSRLGYLNAASNKDINEDYNGLIEQPLCKTLYCINFDEMPYSNLNYRNGLRVAAEDKFKLTITRINDFLAYDYYYNCPDIYTFLYMFVEYYETMMLRSDGKFVYV